jgi:hypothetical protein
MAVRKICTQKGCRASPRCGHPSWFDVMHQRKRWRMPVDDFALARGATEPVESKQTAEHVWEPRFLGEIVAGRDERSRAQVRGCLDARSHHRRTGDVLPAGRDVAHPESSRGLGGTSDRDSWADGEGSGESADSVRSAGTVGADSQAPFHTWPKRVRVRLAVRSLPGHFQDCLGISLAPRQRARHQAGQTRRSRRSRQAEADRPALA